MGRRPFGLTLTVALCAMSLGGCGVGSSALDEAYARGYAEGVASVEDGLRAVDQAYEQGCADGLTDAADATSDDLCQRCYGLGYAEGYQVGIAAAPTAATPGASADS